MASKVGKVKDSRCELEKCELEKVVNWRNENETKTLAAGSKNQRCCGRRLEAKLHNIINGAHEVAKFQFTRGQTHAYGQFRGAARVKPIGPVAGSGHSLL